MLLPQPPVTRTGHFPVFQTFFPAPGLVLTATGWSNAPKATVPEDRAVHTAGVLFKGQTLCSSSTHSTGGGEVEWQGLSLNIYSYKLRTPQNNVSILFYGLIGSVFPNLSKIHSPESPWFKANFTPITADSGTLSSAVLTGCCLLPQAPPAADAGRQGPAQQQGFSSLNN